MVKVVLGLSPFDRGFVTTTILGGIMQRLMNIAHEMNQKLEGFVLSLNIFSRSRGVQLKLFQGRSHVENGIDIVCTSIDISKDTILGRVIAHGVDKVLGSGPAMEKEESKRFLCLRIRKDGILKVLDYDERV